MAALLAGAPAQATPASDSFFNTITEHYRWIAGSDVDHFECVVTPDWHALLSEQNVSGDALARGEAKLKEIVFKASFGPNREAEITHTEPAADNQQMAAALAQIYSGMEQAVRGFFQTDAMFEYNRALFAFVKGPYQWDRAHGVLSYVEQGSDASVRMSFAGDRLTLTDVTAKDFVSSITPQFAMAGGKYSLAGYDATYAEPGGKNSTVLSARMTRQAVDGFEIPQTLMLSGGFEGNAFKVSLTFSDCRAVH